MRDYTVVGYGVTLALRYGCVYVGFPALRLLRLFLTVGRYLIAVGYVWLFVVGCLPRFITVLHLVVVDIYVVWLFVPSYPFPHVRFEFTAIPAPLTRTTQPYLTAAASVPQRCYEAVCYGWTTLPDVTLIYLICPVVEQL